MKGWERALLVAVLVLTLMAVLALAGCGSERQRLTAGKVVDRDDDPAWIQPIITCGKVCTTTYVPHPRDCDIQIEGLPADGGEPVREWHDVNCGDYDTKYAIGDPWP